MESTMHGDHIEAGIRALWTEALGIDGIGLDDDFFDLGGNSLVAVQVLDRICERFQVDLDVAVLFEASTIRLLVAEVTEAVSQPA
jgi:phthiocerol/phenolphthiocerol synthesis type-I polyketide synthase E